jgi:hypothetical protein
MRTHLIRWTGARAAQVPTTLDSSKHFILPARSRLAFCPHCWYDDVSDLRQPFLRKEWAYWSTVHCATHRVFLSAKHVHPDRRHDLVSWRGIWASDETWCRAFELTRRDRSFAESWYAIDDEKPPGDLVGLLSRFRDPVDSQAATALHRALSHELVGRVESVIGSLARSDRALGALESSLNTCQYERPLLLERRIAVLLVASEFLSGV